MSDIYHITPLNDLRDHLEETVIGGYLMEDGEVCPSIKCECECEPRVEYENGAVLIIHNSYDGREGVEWANEVLKQKP